MVYCLYLLREGLGVCFIDPNGTSTHRVTANGGHDAVRRHGYMCVCVCLCVCVCVCVCVSLMLVLVGAHVY